MIIYFIPLAIIILAVLVIIFLVGRHLSDLAALNVESIPEEKVSKVKNRIMLQRLIFNWSKLKKTSQSLFKPIKEQTARLAINLTSRIAELEKKTQQQLRPLNRLDIKQQVDQLLEKATDALTNQDYTEAEKYFINIIDLSANNQDAFEGLVEIYRQKKDYRKARETCRFYLKLLNKKTGGAVASGDKHRLASCYADLGEIYYAEGKNELALKNYQKALEIEANNPRFLDLLLKISILLRNKDLAWQALNRLKEADPENQKLSELRAQVESIETLPL